MRTIKYQTFSLVFGFSVWLVATLIVRYWGEAIFQVENNFLLIGLFLGAVPVLCLLVRWVFSLYNFSADTKLKSAVLMAAPGMICDVVCIKLHAIVFPTLNIEQAIVMASWVLWVYTIVLLIGLIQCRN